MLHVLGLSFEKIKQRVLYLQVYDYDRFSRNDPIGDIYIPLHTINLSEELIHDIYLTPAKGSVSICLYLCLVACLVNLQNQKYYRDKEKLSTLNRKIKSIYDDRNYLRIYLTNPIESYSIPRTFYKKF